MVDEELSAALRAYQEAWYQYHYDPARQRGEAVRSGKERFLAAVGSERGSELWAAIRALQAEADRVPDPGGPLTNYIEALSAWQPPIPRSTPAKCGQSPPL